MAISCASLALPASSSPKPSSGLLQKTCVSSQFLGIPVIASKNSSSLRTIYKPYNFSIRCQEKVESVETVEKVKEKEKREKKKKKVHIPIEQRWMFEPSEVDGPDIWNTTWYPTAADHVPTDKQWYVVDATDKILGRLASTIAIYIRGKDQATYTPSVDMGAHVIVVNAEKVAVSGKKRTQKLYRRHSGRPGGMKIETFDQLQQRIPERIIEHAVRGMLPKGRLGRALFTHLKVYKGSDHPHEAQKPIELPIRDKRIQKER